MTTSIPDLPSLPAMAFVDLDREILVTRRLLKRLPEEHFTWKVHEKSMSLGRLATHVATVLQWFHGTLTKDDLDMNLPPVIPTEAKTRDELLRIFADNAAAVRTAMAATEPAALLRTWTLRQGEKVLVQQPRATILRAWCLNHLIHHRAQLCVYLRILNVPVPAIYFNSADEPDWIFT
jgi:uncharacterized damage-inducible protein DinB